MTIVQLPLTGSGTQSENIQFNPSELINLYETTSYGVPGVRSQSALVRTPGTSLAVAVTGEFRGWIVVNNVLYTVFANTLYSINSAYTKTTLGTIGTSTGRVSMAYNGFHILIDDGTLGYYWDVAGATLNTIVDADYNPSGFVTYQAQSFVYSEPATNVVWVSDLNTAATWNALNFGSMESDPQTVVCCFAIPAHLFVFGQTNTEVWAQDGAQFFPYQPIQGVNIPYGCASRHSICYTNGTIIFLSKNHQGKAMLIGLGSGQTLSNYGGFVPQLMLDEASMYQFSQLTTLSDAKAATFQMNGHIFYAITFPTDNKSFLLDIATKKIIQWASWHNDGADASGNPVFSLGRHLFDDIIAFNSDIIVADYRGGAILKLSSGTYQDYQVGTQNSIQASCTLPAISANDQRITINSLVFDCEKGTSIYSQQDIEDNPALNTATFSVSLSKDSGRTFSYTRDVLFGYSGDYSIRAKADKWGTFRYGALRIQTDHPSRIALFGVIADIEIANTSPRTARG